MSGREAEHAAKQHSRSAGGILVPANREEANAQPNASVALGCGSRSPLVEAEHASIALPQLRGLLPVPPDVEAEIERQQAAHAMTPEYRKMLRDRLTLEHYFSDVEVAFRRTPRGIEVVAAGLDEIAEFRAATAPEERQDVVYGVG
jgi:hypothetical protein